MKKISKTSMTLKVPLPVFSRIYSDFFRACKTLKTVSDELKVITDPSNWR